MKEYNVVKLNKDIPGKKLQKGYKGTIVMAHDDPHLPLAYEVEFININGKTTAIETIKKEDLDLVVEYEDDVRLPNNDKR